MAYDCRGMTEGFFCSYFCNEQEFCILEALTVRKPWEETLQEDQ